MSTPHSRDVWKLRLFRLYRLLARLRMDLAPESVHASPEGERYRINRHSFVERMIGQGEFEPKRAAFLRETVGPDDVFVDIGANIGFFTIIAARRGAMVYAFEPEPSNFRRLQRNLKLNGLEEALVKTHACALGDTTGHATLYRSLTDNYGWMSMVSRYSPDGVTVPVRRLDDILTSAGPRHVVKIDVEGAELKVLDGTRRVMEMLPPGSLWLVEVHDCEGIAASDVAERFRPYGYEIAWFNDTTGSMMPQPPTGEDVLLVARKI